MIIKLGEAVIAFEMNSNSTRIKHSKWQLITILNKFIKIIKYYQFNFLIATQRIIIYYMYVM